MEFAAGGVEGALFFFRAIVNEWAAVLVDRAKEKPVSRFLPLRRIVVKIADDLSAQHPKIVYVPANGLGGEIRCCQMLNEGPETNHQSFTWR